MSALQRAYLSLSPAGYWPLRETTGSTAYDASGNGLNGTYIASPSLASRSLTGFGTALYPDFNGTSQCVDLAGPAALNVSTFTIVLIAVADVIVAERNLLSEDFIGGGNIEYSFGHKIFNAASVGTIGCGNYNGVANYVQSATTITTGRAYMFVGRSNANNYSVFVNGVLDAGPTAKGSATAAYTGVVIGGRDSNGAGTYDTFWDGTIGEVAFYGSSLSDANIAYLYTVALRAGVVY